ncbi:MAG: SCO family protein [Aquisalimonadaceae bacterium]
MRRLAGIRRQQRPGRRRGPGVVGRRLAAIASLLFVTLTVACSDAPQWQTRAIGSEFPELEFELTVDNGDVITADRLQGTVTLLFFGYTYCPDVCPMTLATLSAALRELTATQSDQVRVIFVSVDPARDDPQHLAAYASAFGPQFIGATAEIDRLRQLANRYGSSFQYGPETDNGHYLVTHGSSVLAFDRDGRARLLIGPNDSVKAIAHDLRQLLSS